MKKMALLAALLAIWGSVFGATQKTQPVQMNEQPAPAVVQKQRASEPLDTAGKKKAELNGTEWNIALTSSGTKGKAETDVIVFADDKVVSKNLEGLGYGASGFSVRLQEDGTVIWETMQVSEKDGTAFWRGDIKDGVMRGVLSRRDKKERTVDYSFVSAAK